MDKQVAKKYPIEKILLGGFIVVLAIVFTMSMVAYQNFTSSIISNRVMQQAQYSLNDMEELRASLWTEISEYRAYPIFNNAQFFEKYNQAIPDIQKKLQSLRKQMAANIYQQQQQQLDKLEPLINELLDFGSQIINLAKAQQSQAAAEMIRTAKGAILMEQITQIITDMESEQHKQIQAGLVKVEDKNKLVYLSLLATFILQLIILGGLYYLFRRNLQRRNQAEAIVRISEERFQNVTRATTNVIWDWDLITDKIWFNENILTTFNYASEQVDKDIAWYLENIHKEEQQNIRHSINAAIENGSNNWSGEYRFRRGDGSYADVYDRACIIRDEAGNPIRMIGAMMDITERKKIEKMKNEFISAVSHELRTPLTSIRGSLGLIIGEAAGAIPEKANKLLNIAYQNCERLIRLINDILDIEKIEAGKMVFNIRQIELNAFVKEALEADQAYAEKFNVSLQLESTVPTITVKADYDRLMQVLTNVLSNAVKFSPAGGQVVISIAQKNDKACISIRDQGKGIPEEFQQRIFQKFAQADNSSTRSNGGTGLGLSISQAIIEKLGGSIGFETKINVGTTFYVELPASTEVVCVINTTTDSLQPNILICEDDKDLASLLSVMLVQNGFQV